MVPFVFGFGFDLAPGGWVSALVLVWNGVPRQFLPVTPPSHL